jgi:hypothetical protein
MSKDEPIPDSAADEKPEKKPPAFRILTKEEASQRRRQREQDPIDPDDQAWFRGYTSSKAESMVEKGLEEYRAGDFFGYPFADWTAEQLEGVLTGCEQMVADRGYTLETPMNGVSITGCYALIYTLHFEVIGRQTHRPEHGTARLEEGVLTRPEKSLYIDEMRCKHRVSDHVSSLFNQLVYPRRERRPKAPTQLEKDRPLPEAPHPWLMDPLPWI